MKVFASKCVQVNAYRRSSSVPASCVTRGYAHNTSVSGLTGCSRQWFRFGLRIVKQTESISLKPVKFRFPLNFSSRHQTSETLCLRVDKDEFYFVTLGECVGNENDSNFKWKLIEGQTGKFRIQWDRETTRVTRERNELCIEKSRVWDDDRVFLKRCKPTENQLFKFDL